ncbi:MAG: hypothetical protein KJO96_01665 [Winogradskyella sp.]|nr:hypothetical protein [Winogradskyella sp.]
MRVKYPVIKLVVLLAVVSGLFAFSNIRNSERPINGTQINFLGEDNLYITHETVSKLLILNQESVTDKPKEIIDLNQLENALKSNKMVKNAEVFVSVEGTLTAEIVQKRPIARVSNEASFYIDEEGSYMPLSGNYTARVPLVTGDVNKDQMDAVFQFAKAVDTDDFLKKHVIQIHQNENGSIDFRIRNSQAVVKLGYVEHLTKKINNFKAFYQKAVKDNILNKYSVINLTFNSQVICTKL